MIYNRYRIRIDVTHGSTLSLLRVPDRNFPYLNYIISFKTLLIYVLLQQTSIVHILLSFTLLLRLFKICDRVLYDLLVIGYVNDTILWNIIFSHSMEPKRGKSYTDPMPEYKTFTLLLFIRSKYLPYYIMSHILAVPQSRFLLYSIH